MLQLTQSHQSRTAGDGSGLAQFRPHSGGVTAAPDATGFEAPVLMPILPARVTRNCVRLSGTDYSRESRLRNSTSSVRGSILSSDAVLTDCSATGREVGFSSIGPFRGKLLSF